MRLRRGERRGDRAAAKRAAELLVGSVAHSEGVRSSEARAIIQATLRGLFTADDLEDLITSAGAGVESFEQLGQVDRKQSTEWHESRRQLAIALQIESLRQ